MTEIDYIAHLQTDGEALAAALERGPLDAPVMSCPGWTLRDLGNHIGMVHRWATVAATTAAQPVPGSYETSPPDATPVAEWVRQGLGPLVAALTGLAPDAPTWHPFPIPRVGAVWPRRQAQETSIHRWDAETAIGVQPALDPLLASDGIDEYFEVALPRLAVRERVSLPTGSLHVHCTDVSGEWLVRAAEGELIVERAHAKGDAALRGPAGKLLLRLWGRRGDEADNDAVQTIGDPGVVEAWLTLGGI